MLVTHFASPCASCRRANSLHIRAQKQQRLPTKPRAASAAAESTSTSQQPLQRPQPPTPSAQALAATPASDHQRPNDAAAAALSQPAVASTTAPSTSGRGASQTHPTAAQPGPRGRLSGRRGGGRRMGTKGNLRRWTNQELWQSLCTVGPSLEMLETYPLQVLNFAIKDLAAGGLVQPAKQLVLFLVEHRRANEHTLAQFFNGCCLSREGVDAANDMAVLALDLAQQETQKTLLTEHATTALVLLLLESEGAHGALRVLGKLCGLGCPVGVEPFNSIVHHCATNSDTDGVMETFQALQQQAARGITTDKYTYSGVLRGLMEAKMYNMALELYAHVITQGIQPDAMLYCQWITCCAYTSRPKDAELLFSKLQEEGIKPNTHLYNALLNVYAEVGDAPRAQDVYVQMTSTPGVVPDAFTYVALLKAGQRSGKHSVADVDMVMKEMASRHVSMNYHVLSALITSYRMADDDLELRRRLAMRAFEKAYSNPRIRSGTAALYLSMMAMHGECGDIESLLHVYDLMVSAGVEPDESTFNLVLKHCRDKGWDSKYDEVLELKNTMAFLRGRG